MLPRAHASCLGFLIFLLRYPHLQLVILFGIKWGVLHEEYHLREGRRAYAIACIHFCVHVHGFAPRHIRAAVL
ncbi:hypothetical protein K437DRAFT_255595 [Tilletiaria anomala UBC 951]|uniref:Uncharacterized protein n=1 Tax=Tilletiaria anomala (strain ATCC 24038 / CBS 436.72 / UBC 951) TaxID=1037660 RepID=A0A066WBL5_TILAU|nr:uncharacterized protein K437DRAFT_255595 [Tilletiaria anomala UBC 951]KDN48175.1 hypothetical protein K437DRAFT_255595 [Tilletiaria anomala UBC 951]